MSNQTPNWVLHILEQLKIAGARGDDITLSGESAREVWLEIERLRQRIAELEA